MKIFIKNYYSIQTYDKRLNAMTKDKKDRSKPTHHTLPITGSVKLALPVSTWPA
jgi:hypothetical protein